MKKTILPGGVRIRCKAVTVGKRVQPPNTNDIKIEVQQKDGSWIPLRGVVRADIRLNPNAMVNSTMRVELAELDIEAPEPVVKRRKVKP